MTRAPGGTGRHAVARPSGDAHLGQWPWPGLHRHHRLTTSTCSPSPTASKITVPRRPALSFRLCRAATAPEALLGPASGLCRRRQWQRGGCQLRRLQGSRHAAQELFLHRRLGRHHRQILDGGRHPAQRRNLNGAYLGYDHRRRHQSLSGQLPAGGRNIAPGAAASVTHQCLFAGAKVVDICAAMSDSQGIFAVSTRRWTGAGSGSSPSRSSGLWTISTNCIGNFGLAIWA